MSDQSLDVVIVSWNVCDLLAQCLTSPFADLDAASIDSSPGMIHARFARVEIMAIGGNLGFVGGSIGLLFSSHFGRLQ